MDREYNLPGGAMRCDKIISILLPCSFWRLNCSFWRLNCSFWRLNCSLWSRISSSIPSAESTLYLSRSSIAFIHLYRASHSAHQSE